jgi:hypothetical protein
MKKYVFLLLILLLGCSAPKNSSRSIPNLNFGSGPNTGTGESINSFAHKTQILIDDWNRLGMSDVLTTSDELNILHNLDPNLVYIGDIAVLTAQVDAALTDNTPTDAEITSALGKTAIEAGKGYTKIIKDTSGSGLIYICISDGAAWQYIKLTIAI